METIGSSKWHGSCFIYLYQDQSIFINHFNLPCSTTNDQEKTSIHINIHREGNIMQTFKERIRKVEEDYRDTFEQISHFIFTNPELGGEEHKSVEYLANLMEREGFTVTQPYGGEETGFRAEIGDGDGPTLAFLAEYDALPGYGPKGEPGHACGHNWISATSAGAAIVLSKLMDEWNGKVVLIGTPAEESYGGKVLMAEQGAFRDVDIVLQTHLDQRTEVAPQALAMASFQFHFKGKAAHAAQFPHKGINALDAVQLTFAGINALRQHVTSDVRIHGIVTDGGAAANIVPEHSACLFYVRAEKYATVLSVSEKVKNCARGAALMTGAECEILQPESSLYNLIDIPVLVELAEKNMGENGIDPVHRTGEGSYGSSDIGNVSCLCPTVYMEIALDGVDFMVHEASALDYADSKLSHQKLHQVIKGMAGMAADLFTEPELVKQAQEEHLALVEENEK